jgi:hypothetical protein
VTHGAADTDAHAHLPSMQRRIMQIVGQDDTDEGMHVTAITKQIGGNNSEAVM